MFSDFCLWPDFHSQFSTIRFDSALSCALPARPLFLGKLPLKYRHFESSYSLAPLTKLKLAFGSFLDATCNLFTL